MGDRSTNTARDLAKNGHATPELVEMLSAEMDRSYHGAPRLPIAEGERGRVALERRLTGLEERLDELEDALVRERARMRTR